MRIPRLHTQSMTAPPAAVIVIAALVTPVAATVMAVKVGLPLVQVAVVGGAFAAVAAITHYCALLLGGHYARDEDHEHRERQAAYRRQVALEKLHETAERVARTHAAVADSWKPDHEMPAVVMLVPEEPVTEVLRELPPPAVQRSTATPVAGSALAGADLMEQMRGPGRPEGGRHSRAEADAGQDERIGASVWLDAVERLRTALTGTLRPHELVGQQGRGVVQLADELGSLVPELPVVQVEAYIADHRSVAGGEQPALVYPWATVLAKVDPLLEGADNMIAEAIAVIRGALRAAGVAGLSQAELARALADAGLPLGMYQCSRLLSEMRRTGMVYRPFTVSAFRLPDVVSGQ